MRKVKLLEYNKLLKQCQETDAPITFVSSGVDYDKFETGTGNFYTTIIELPDGDVKNTPLHLFKFIDVT